MASTIVAILSAEPKPLTAIQPLSPPALEHLIKTCLAKDPDERLQSAHDVKVQMQWIAQVAPQSVEDGKSAARATTNRLAWWLVGLLLLLVAGSGEDECQVRIRNSGHALSAASAAIYFSHGCRFLRCLSRRAEISGQQQSGRA